MHGFTHGFGCGEVDYALYAGILVEEEAEGCDVGAVGLHEVRADAGDALNAVEDVAVGVAQVVDYDYGITGFLELHDGVGADVSGATCH